MVLIKTIPSDPLLLLVHGWGFGPGIWRALIRALPGWECCTLNLGFFGKPQLLPPVGRPFLAVGHSLGFLWLLHQMEMDQTRWHRFCLGLVSIAGFSRFSRCIHFPYGVPPQILQRMIRRLPDHGTTVLAEFRQQSGWHGNPGLLPAGDGASLLQGLEWLQQWDERVILAAWSGHLGVLAAQDDQIVPPQLTTACFAANTVHWLATGGHLLPLTQVAACADLIKNLGRQST